MSPNSKTRIRRFSPVQRLFHLLLILCFMTQAFTGLARMYIETVWGQKLAWVFGGYTPSRTVHIYVGIFMIFIFALHILYMISRVNWREFPRSLFGPDSMLPQPRDLKESIQHFGWLLGMAKAPRFDRWGYWEKFDYIGVCWGMCLLGITGMLMAYPLVASRIMPGWGLNVAFWVHKIEAILAMGHVFIIHFFIAHLRPHAFPMDRSMFEGSVDLAATHHEKPDWVARLEETGKLESVLVPEAPGWRRVFHYVFGYCAVALGIFLLIGALVNSLSITW
jgi:cytochrome b subunit of formate dehydrogenase